MSKIVRTALAAILITAAGAAAAHPRHAEDYTAVSPYGYETPRDLWVYPHTAVEPHGTATGGPVGGLPGGS